MATKKELEEQLKLLKDKLKTANRAIKDLTAKQIDDTMELQDLPNEGVAIIKSSEGPHKVVTLKFDLDSGTAKVSDVEEFSRASFHMATAKVNSKLTEMISKK
jgi:hypothetical protein